MDKILLSCPHCGFTREVPRERIPQTARNVACPSCQRKFPLADATSPLDEIVQENSSQSWKYWEGLGVSRAASDDCRQQTASATAFTGLLRSGWRIYLRNWQQFSAAYLYMLLLSGLPWVVYWQIRVGGIPVSTRWQESLLVLLLTLGLSALGLALGSCSLLQLVVNDQADFRQALRCGVRSLPGYLGLSCWMVFLVAGGGLLLIPGVVFAGLFSLAFFVFLHEKERGPNALCISAQYVGASLWSNLGKIAALFGILLLGTALLITQIVALPYVLVCLYLVYGEARRQVVAPRQLAGSGFKRYFVLPVIAAYLLAVAGAALVMVRQQTAGGFSTAQLRQLAGSLVIDSWKLSGVAPPGCGLVLEETIVRPGGQLKVRLIPSSKIDQNYYLCVTGGGGPLGESHLLDQETLQQRLVHITAPNMRGDYQIEIFSDYDRTVAISSIAFQVN